MPESGQHCFNLSICLSEVGCCWFFLQRVEAWEMGSIWQREYSREPEKSGSYSSMYEPINTVMPVGSPVAV